MSRRSAAKIDDRLDSVFSALADPTRRRMLVRLARGEASITELAEPFDMTLPAIWYTFDEALAIIDAK